VGTSVASRVLLLPPSPRSTVRFATGVQTGAAQGLKTARLAESRNKGRRAKEDFLERLQLRRGARVCGKVGCSKTLDATLVPTIASNQYGRANHCVEKF